MSFKDAGTELQTVAADVPAKIYPRFNIDVKEFPELQGNVDEHIEFRVRGRICERVHNDWSNSITVEALAISKCGEKEAATGPYNEADKAMEKLKSARSY